MTKMKSAVAVAALAALTACGGGGASSNGAVSRACNGSDRSAANPALCGCIQRVANQTLSASDQRRAARFFRDPHESQETRMSDNRGDEAFWLRYKNFGNQAARYCR